MDNKGLQEIYDSGKLNFYPGYDEAQMIMGLMDSWRGLKVLEIGCGSGNLAAQISMAGALKVIGIDYAPAEIKKAEARFKISGLSFINSDCYTFKKGVGPCDTHFDVVVMQGVLEHLDDPWDELAWIMKTFLKVGGHVALSVPAWINPRGYIYHTCRLLFGGKMSLTDLHWFLPDDFDAFAEATGHKIQVWGSCDRSRGSGKDMLADLLDRLPKALPEVETGKVEAFIDFIAKMLDEDSNVYKGATMGVLIKKSE